MAPEERFQSRFRLSLNRRDFQYLGLLFAAIALIFWDVVFLQKAFLSGDHLIQHYPWAKFLQKSLRHFHLPWWTSQIQSGFPLLAEGQIGAFYPPNVVFLFLLPLKFAYNYEVLFHFALGAVFFYLYLKQIRISSEAAFFATLIFLFGSCEGGFFYNITSQRVSAWFALSLFTVEGFTQKFNWRDVAILAFVIAFQIFAGYLQVAIYCMAFTALYFLLRNGPKIFSRPSVGLMVAVILGLGISAIQWIPSIRLSAYSARAEALEPLAYMGSVSPFFLMTLLFPAWTGLWRGGVYAGVLGLFFVLWSLFTKKAPLEKTWLWILLISIALALGKYNPLYVLGVKIFKIYFFRIPSKFLFFSSFSLAVLAALGFDKFLQESVDLKVLKKTTITLVGFFLFIVITIGAGHLAARVYKEPLLNSMESYVKEQIYAKPYHPHSLETYLDRLHLYYDYFLEITTLKAKETWRPILFFLVMMALAISIMRGKDKGKICVALCALLFLDFYFYTKINTRTDLEPYDKVNIRSSLVETILKDKSIFRIHEFNTNPLKLDSFPLIPNKNMLLGISDTGIYSPFAFSEYKKYLGGLGGIDDSLFQNPSTFEALATQANLLNRLNVKYIFSNIAITKDGWEKVGEEKVFLYENKNVWPRAFYADSLENIKDLNTSQEIEILNKEEGRMILNTAGFKMGFAVISEQNYPGWKYRAGKQIGEPVSLGNCLKAIPLSGTEERIELFYEEKDKNFLFVVSFLSLFLTLSSLAFHKACF